MPLVAAAITPHGFPVIPELGEHGDEGGRETPASMRAVGELFRRQGVEAVIVVGPHGIRVDGAFALVDAARVAGTLSWKGRHVEANVPLDRTLIEAIAAAAPGADLPVARVGYAGNRADQAVVPLDWGALVPLWFLGHDQNEAGTGDVLGDPPKRDTGPAAVLIVPSRALPREAMVAFGRLLGHVIAADSRQIGFVASCDWAHTHSEDGPYGWDEAAERVDTVVRDAISRNALATLINLPAHDVEHAAIDGLWQSLILAGVQEVTPFVLELRSYEVPTYYGMMVASAEVPHG
jgi:aromatic ring-opening dioxygenase LigB subunit